MTGQSTVIKTVTRVERLDNSRNGTPRYHMHFEDGTDALTQSDSACAYEIQNQFVSGETFELGLTRAGRVWSIRKVAPMNHGQALGYLESTVALFLTRQASRAELERALNHMRSAVELHMVDPR
jgi:hypothetical protein